VVDAHQTGLVVMGSRGRGELTKSPSRQCEPSRAGPHSRASDGRRRRGMRKQNKVVPTAGDHAGKAKQEAI